MSYYNIEKFNLNKKKTVPTWLFDRCQSIYEPPKPTIINTPKNTAAIRGTSANLNCTARNLGLYGTVSWFYKSIETGESLTLSANNIIYPTGQSLIEIFDTYNLRIIEVDSDTTGLFQCNALDENLSGIYEAFLLEMGKYFQLKVINILYLNNHFFYQKVIRYVSQKSTKNLTI